MCVLIKWGWGVFKKMSSLLLEVRIRREKIKKTQNHECKINRQRQRQRCCLSACSCGLQRPERKKKKKKLAHIGTGFFFNVFAVMKPVFYYYESVLLTWVLLSVSQPGVEVVASGDELISHFALQDKSSVINTPNKESLSRIT